MKSENDEWMNRGRGSIFKKIVYGILSVIKGLGSGLLFVAWLLVGTTLASAYVPSFEPVKSLIWSIWGLLFILISVYETIKNFKEVK